MTGTIDAQLEEWLDGLRDRFGPYLKSQYIERLLPDDLLPAYKARLARESGVVVVSRRPKPSTKSRRAPDPGATRGPRRKKVPAEIEREVLGRASACHYCSDAILPRQVEHVRPVSRGGTNDRSNLVAACIGCNSQKRAMLVHEWRQSRAASGMCWPPVASHATDPRHYRAVCRDCQRADRAAGRPTPDHRWRVVPYGVEVQASGYRTLHQCPVGHFWTCGRAFDTTYFSDCPCSYCITSCLEDDVERDRPMTFWTVTA